MTSCGVGGDCEKKTSAKHGIHRVVDHGHSHRKCSKTKPVSVGIMVCFDALLNALCTPLERPTLTHVVYILLEQFLRPYRETGDDTAYTERHERAEMELFMHRLDTLLDTILDNPTMWLKDDFEKLRKFSYTVGHDAEHFPPILPAAATQLVSQTRTNGIALTKDVAKRLYSQKPCHHCLLY